MEDDELEGALERVEVEVTTEAEETIVEVETSELEDEDDDEETLLLKTEGAVNIRTRDKEVRGKRTRSCSMKQR